MEASGSMAGLIHHCFFPRNIKSHIPNATQESQKTTAEETFGSGV